MEVIEEESDRATAYLRELWRRIAFSILVSNRMTTFEITAFCAQPPVAGRSPAFDINPNPEPGPKFLNTSIDGRSNAASIERLFGMAEFFRLDDGEAQAVLAEVSQATSRWQEVASRHGLDRASINQMRYAFEHESAELARRQLAA